MFKLAGEFIKSGNLIDSVSKTDSRLLSFADALIDRKKIDNNAFIRDTFQTIFNTTPAAFARSAEYKNALQSVSDSVVTSAIDNSVSAKSKFILLQLARALKGISDLASEKPVTVGTPVKKNHFILQAQMRKYKPIMDADSWIIWENNVGVLHYKNDKGQDKLENSFLFNLNYNSDLIECRPDPVSPEKDAFLNHLKNFIPVADALLLWEALKRM